VIPGAIDLRRFNPDRELPDMRARLGIPADAFVVGIVARMQTHRRYEDLIEAAALLVEASDRFHFVSIGRGTKQEGVAYAPVRAKRLEARVHFAGYLSGDEYVGMVKAFDVKVFLVPGSDGTCRAVREAMAMGKPVVAARRGMLPELVEDGVTGMVGGEGAGALVAALHGLEQDPACVHRLGRAAREKALWEFDPSKQAQRVAEIYRRVMSG
jgi:glycosyltransferase involved in cell wall biosynthesis